jgi:hypothetical protein
VSGLADLIAEAQVNRGGRPCPVVTLLQSLKPDDAQALQAQLSLERTDHGYLPNHLVAKIVTEYGHNIDERMVWRHRTKRCRCRGAV